MAGNAIGLGNFLRFPVQAAKYGGGAFMIPYFVSFLLLGIPLMWVEWSIGRYGGTKGHGSLPGMFDSMWNRKVAKYLGILGIGIPLFIVSYYTFIESWTLAFGFFSVTGSYMSATSAEGMGAFLNGYLGVEKNGFFGTIAWAYLFFIVTLAINIYVLSRGVAKGIETTAKLVMPMLFVFAIILAIRVLTLGTPDPLHPDWNIENGLAFMWVPDFGELGNWNAWLGAAGQIFFTLSLGAGTIHTYASYLKEKDDVVLTGLATGATNEFTEVILGGTIAIPASVAFFGAAATTEIAAGGSFNVGFIALPRIFQQLPAGRLFGALWFFLLFFAGITSSLALAQPSITFLQDEFKMSRKRAACVVGAVIFAIVQPCIFFLSKGFLDEIDFWVGTWGLSVLALIETIIFAWIFGMKKAWAEMHRGADMRIPRIFRFIIKYVTPAFLLFILIAWTSTDAVRVLTFRGVASENIPYLVAARLLMVAVFAAIGLLVYFAWRRKSKAEAANDNAISAGGKNA